MQYLRPYVHRKQITRTLYKKTKLGRHGLIRLAREFVLAKAVVLALAISIEQAMERARSPDERRRLGREGPPDRAQDVLLVRLGVGTCRERRVRRSSERREGLRGGDGRIAIRVTASSWWGRGRGGQQDRRERATAAAA